MALHRKICRTQVLSMHYVGYIYHLHWDSLARSESLTMCVMILSCAPTSSIFLPLRQSSSFVSFLCAFPLVMRSNLDLWYDRNFGKQQHSRFPSSSSSRNLCRNEQLRTLPNQILHMNLHSVSLGELKFRTIRPQEQSSKYRRVWVLLSCLRHKIWHCFNGTDLYKAMMKQHPDGLVKHLLWLLQPPRPKH